MAMRIKVGQLDVYEAGTVLARYEETVDFYYENVRVSIEFRDDDETEKPNISTEFREENHLAVILKNFKSPLGHGLVDPLRIGTMGGRNLYLNFWIYTHGKAKSREIV